MEDRYMGFKRLLAFLASVGLWGVSMYFSYSGFKFESTEILWFGVVLALTVTVVELVFNTKIKDLNPTLIIIGIVCYLYGTYTNITGFYILQHGNLDNFFTKSSWIIPVFAGLVCEVLPEALLAWSWGVFDKGDLVGNIGEIFGTSPSPSYKKEPQGNFNRPLQNQQSKKPTPKFNHQASFTPNRQQNKGKSLPRPIPNSSFALEAQGDEDTEIPASSYRRPEPNYHPIGMNAQGGNTRNRLNEGKFEA